MLSSINHEQGLYVLSEGTGFTCLGFDVALQWSQGIYDWLISKGKKLDPPKPELKGTPEGYADYQRIVAAGGNYNRRTKERCPALLDKQLIGLEGKRVEVVDCYGEKRRFWVGKSTGWLPIHLEIKTSRSTGGFGTTGPYQSVRVVQQR